MVFIKDKSDDGKENKNAPLWRGLSQSQTRQFLKSVKKWGIQKSDVIVRENTFPDDFKINEATHELLESLVQCERLSAGKGKGPSLKLGAQPIPVKVTLTRIRALTTLYEVAENIDELDIPSKVRSINNWTCNWTDKEDLQLLKSMF